jgi:3-oxoacyl-[acyl-carrier-protein] synthase III
MSHLRSRISGLGMCVPPAIVSNTDLKQWMETSDEWISQRTGIRERRWAAADTLCTTSGLALDACVEALAEASLEPKDVGLIVFATLSPDCVFPGSACFLQAKLGVPGIPALDIRQQCTGFVYGLSIADLYVRAGHHRHVLVVCSEVQSKALDKSTRGREMTVLFGDGAGAVVVSAAEVKDASARSKESFLISHHLHADGTFADDLVFRSPGTSNRIWNPPELVREPEAHPQMNGRVVFQNAVKRMPEVAREAIAANGLTVDDVDLFVNHQANKRINDRFAESMGVPPEKVFDTIERYGNTTAATIPIGLYEAVRQGRLRRGMLVLSAAFGSGFTWGASLFRW